jgi:hypothetical protein
LRKPRAALPWEGCCAEYKIAEVPVPGAVAQAIPDRDLAVDPGLREKYAKIYRNY